MDIGLFFTIGIAVVIIVLVIILYIRTPHNKRNFPIVLDAQEKVALYLKNKFPNSPTFKNLVLLIGEDSQEIDSLIIHRNGIFVIATKGWKGRVEVRDDGKTWVSSPENNGQFMNQVNPIKQNVAHIDFVKKILELDKEVQSVVVFSEDNAPDFSYDVIDLKDLENYIKTHKNTYFDDANILFYEEKLKNYLHDHPRSHDEHVKYINNKHNH